jgi:hypothetical protein
MALGIVTWLFSTGTRLMLPRDARATLEFEVPKSIPQDVVLMVIAGRGKSFKDSEFSRRIGVFLNWLL